MLQSAQWASRLHHYQCFGVAELLQELHISYAWNLWNNSAKGTYVGMLPSLHLPRVGDCPHPTAALSLVIRSCRMSWGSCCSRCHAMLHLTSGMVSNTGLVLGLRVVLLAWQADLGPVDVRTDSLDLENPPVAYPHTRVLELSCFSNWGLETVAGAFPFDRHGAAALYVGEPYLHLLNSVILSARQSAVLVAEWHVLPCYRCQAVYMCIRAKHTVLIWTLRMGMFRNWSVTVQAA